MKANTWRAVACAALALWTGCAERGDPHEPVLTRGPRDVVLVTIDTLRWDAPGFMGVADAGRAETPLLDRLAAEGEVFENAHAHAVVTLPSHASILTGLYPYQHGIRDNARFTLESNAKSLAAVLKSAGYETAAFVSAFPLDRRFGLAAGFDVYDDEYGGASPASLRIAERRGEETVARALSWWGRSGSGPRLLWVHLFTPHFPYEPAEPFATQHRAAPYLGEVAWADAQLGPLLEPLLAAGSRPALVVVTSDHGESLGEHGEQTHGLFAYEATLRVPLVLWAPGMLEHARRSDPARHVDILPTICDLVGVPVPPGLPGRSLFSGGPSEGGSYFEALSAYFNRGWAPLVGRIEAGEKAIRLPTPELYRLSQDPGEQDNLAESEPERLRTILAAVPQAAFEPAEPGRLEAEDVARLRSLGYLSADPGPTVSGRFDPAADPKELIEHEHTVDRALGAWQRGETAEALDLLRKLIDRQPRMAVAYSHLASMYTDLGKLQAATETLSTAVARGVSTEDIRVRLALALARTGHPEQASGILRGDEGSADPETQSALGRVEAMLGRPEQARQRFAKALSLDPTYPAGWVDLGTLLLDAGDLTGAREHLERGLVQDPTLSEGWNALGVVRSRQGDEAGARQAWERAVAEDSRCPDALFNLALAYGKSGDYDRAQGLLATYAGLVEGPEQARARALLEQLRARSGGS